MKTAQTFRKIAIIEIAEEENDVNTAQTLGKFDNIEIVEGVKIRIPSFRTARSAAEFSAAVAERNAALKIEANKFIDRAEELIAMDLFDEAREALAAANKCTALYVRHPSSK